MSQSAEHSSTAETELAQILREISDQGWSLQQWAQHEAGDWFQTEHLFGGFEAEKSYRDGQFTFTYYDQHQKEWWFTFRLEDVETLRAEGFKGVSLVDPETFDVNALENGTQSPPGPSVRPRHFRCCPPQSRASNAPLASVGQVVRRSAEDFAGD